MHLAKVRAYSWLNPLLSGESWELLWELPQGSASEKDFPDAH